MCTRASSSTCLSLCSGRAWTALGGCRRSTACTTAPCRATSHQWTTSMSLRVCVCASDSLSLSSILAPSIDICIPPLLHRFQRFSFSRACAVPCVSIYCPVSPSLPSPLAPSLPLSSVCPSLCCGRARSAGAVFTACTTDPARPHWTRDRPLLAGGGPRQRPGPHSYLFFSRITNKHRQFSFRSSSSHSYSPIHTQALLR